ncbi:LuxR C-terminal-related transcriptional regulator [Mycobacterium sp. HUMS_1102779]|uniref:LuxR C-terminal-related transcriptional regulator n=1 Tax=Mycobacterium sp. HUMS_1102779 TaxID=3383487 RepID=UPI00389A75E3
MHTPALTAAARPLPLSAREREIANLLVAGLSTREIAERLVVSKRTAGGVGRVGGRLHVASAFRPDEIAYPATDVRPRSPP